MQAQRNEVAAVREAADKVGQAKAKAVEVLEGWQDLPDVDASSGELERAIEPLGRVERDLDDEADAMQEGGS